MKVQEEFHSTHHKWVKQKQKEKTKQQINHLARCSKNELLGWGEVNLILGYHNTAQMGKETELSLLRLSVIFKNTT